MADPAVLWLLRSRHASVRHAALTELAGVSPRAAEAVRARTAIPRSRWVHTLVAGQRRDGSFGVHPYKKWDGAHWRLVSLVELGLPPGHPRAVAAFEHVLAWLHGPSHRAGIPRINGLVRRCASQEGNALRVGSRLGLAADPRVRRLAHDLLEWQWPDGGWNCDRRPGAHHSSFHESLIPLWGLLEYRDASGDDAVRPAIERAAEFFLRHRLFRSERDGSVIATRGVWGAPRSGAAASGAFLQMRYPPYWHYDVLSALRVMGRAGKLGDARVQEALDIVADRRGPDRRWRADGRWWRPAGRARSAVEVVDWGPNTPNEMVTLNALRVLRAAGRVQ
ncbi:MAG TPA: hypothetical protein VFW08_13890 [bacterium]|nr:hypothetical protein [bacterium]